MDIEDAALKGRRYEGKHQAAERASRQFEIEETFYSAKRYAVKPAADRPRLRRESRPHSKKSAASAPRLTLRGEKAPLRLQGDGGEEAAGAGALFAVAEEERGVAGGAEAGGKDIFFEEAGGEELGAIGFGEIEVNVFRRRLVAGGHHVEPLKRIGFFAGAGFVEKIGSVGELRCELNDEFGADFVAAGADAGADSGEEVGRI